MPSAHGKDGGVLHVRLLGASISRRGLRRWSGCPSLRDLP